jgi:hypothetical protein
MSWKNYSQRNELSRLVTLRELQSAAGEELRLRTLLPSVLDRVFKESCENLSHPSLRDTLPKSIGYC